MTTDHDERKRAARETVATFDTYRQAERAVDHLSDRGFEVDRVAIVGTRLSIIEDVTGRVTAARAALVGAAHGAFVALLFTLLLGLFFTVAEGFWALLITALAVGVVVGSIVAAATHAARGGRRDFASTSRLHAERLRCRQTATSRPRRAGCSATWPRLTVSRSGAGFGPPERPPRPRSLKLGTPAGYRLSLAAIAGLAFGAGLSIGTNVPGAVLAVYGAVLALLVVAAVIVSHRRWKRSHERLPSGSPCDDRGSRA